MRTKESSELEAAKVPPASTATEMAPRVCPGRERRGSADDDEEEADHKNKRQRAANDDDDDLDVDDKLLDHEQ
jgi:hypothetical protein